MSETKNTDNEKEEPKKTLSLGGKGTLSLKGGAPRSKQSAPGGVAVEVRRARSTRANAAPANHGTESVSTENQDIETQIATPTPAPATSQETTSNLTDNELNARAKALQKALAEGDKSKSSLPKRHTIETKKHEERIKKAQEEAEKALAEKASDTGDKFKAKNDKFTPVETEDTESYRDRMKKAVKPSRKDEGNAWSNSGGRRITVTQALNLDHEKSRGKSLAAQKRAREKARLASLKSQEPALKIVRDVIVPETITVGELANRMAEPAGDVVKKLMKLGVMATITQSIDADTAELIIEEFGHKIKRVTDADVEIGLGGIDDNANDLIIRPPVVTIMGHVDHGKTSLLDALRSTDVVAGEAGGITQHIGAYQVTMSSGDKITFLDTPGHSAFTEMRARGAHVTDIVVIVVAANDSIMPQTIEAISHAKAANVPIIIAINKIDLPGVDPMKIKTDLLQYEIVVEDLSGDVQCIEISAKKKINLDKLEEAILIQSEVLELKANPNRMAQGVVVESKMEKGRGSVATILVQNGTLRVGDIFVVGAEYGKIRAIMNDKGESITEAPPGLPVEILGLSGTPAAGDILNVTNDDGKAKEISEYRQRKIRQAQAVLAVKGRTTIEQLLEQRESGEKTILPVLIKADVHGSIEAIAGSLKKLEDENPDIGVQILHMAVGGITESDVTLAKASRGVIIGFNVRANAQARDMAQRDGVDIRYYNIIYNVIDDAKAILTGMLSPRKREEYLGQAKILQVFNITKVGKVAGCMVEVGSVKRGAKVRLLRDDIVIHEGMLKTLKRHQDEVKEVKEGTECGMAFENYDDIKAGDIIECYEIIEEARVVN